MKRKGKIALIGIIVGIIILAVILTTTLSARVLEKYRNDILKNGTYVEVLEVLSPVEYLVKNNNNEYKVRLLNTYPPNDNQIYEEALKEAERFILGDNVYLIYDEDKTDSNGTPIVLLYYAKANYLLNATLIDRGYAIYEHKHPCWLKNELKALQENAKLTGKGIWKSENVKLMENRIEQLNLKIKELSEKLDESGDDIAQQIQDLKTVKLPDEIEDQEFINDKEDTEEDSINVYIEESPININELEDIIEEEAEEEDKTSIDDKSYLEDNIEDETTFVDLEDLIEDNRDVTEISIDEIINDNTFLDINELLSDKNREELTEDLDESFFQIDKEDDNDITEDVSTEFLTLPEDWAKVAFSLRLENFYDSEMDFLKTSLFLTDIFGDEIDTFMDLNLIDYSQSLTGIASDVDKGKPEILLFLYGDFHNIDLVPTDIYDGKKYLKTSDDYSIFVQSNRMIVIGTDKGVKNYITNLGEEIESNMDFNNFMERFSISKPIKELNLNEKENWLYMDINEQLKEQLYLITGQTKDIQALSLIYKPIEDLHQFDFTFIADNEDSISELELLMTGFRDMIGTIGISSPTFVEIIQGIDFTHDNNKLNFGFSFTNQDIININKELDNPLTLDLDDSID